MILRTRAQAAERAREQRSLPWIERFAADARYALRHFRRTPLATITMVLVLSLGIGTTVVLFTVVNSLATLPGPGIARDDALVRIRGTTRMDSIAGLHARLLSWPEVEQYAERTELFSSVAAHAHETAVISAGDLTPAPVTANLIYATPNHFSILNVRPALGTLPAAEPNVMRMATPPTAMISHAMWRQTFGGAREVIGRVVRINDMPVEIVGVAPPRFIGTGGGGALTIWVPLAAYPTQRKRTPAAFISSDSMFLSAVARLRPGITTKTATPAIAAIATRVTSSSRMRAQRETGSADVVPMLASNSRVSERADLLISEAVSGGLALLVLLITCTNVSALMVGRAVARRREISVRLSLGAPRKRLIRHSSPRASCWLSARQQSASW
jgi:hypothetical protein